MKILQRVLVLSVAALLIFGALSANAQAAERRGGYSARAGAGHHGGNRVHRAPRAQGFNRGGRDFYRGGRGYYRGGRGSYRGGRGYYRGGRGYYRGGRGYYRGGRGYYRGGRGYYRGGHRVRRHAGHRGYFYRGYVGCRPTFSFFYDSYGNRIRLIGSGCF